MGSDKQTCRAFLARELTGWLIGYRAAVTADTRIVDAVTSTNQRDEKEQKPTEGKD